MSIQKTTTDLTTLKINYLTQAMYEDALENDEINDNELYFTPGSGDIDVNDMTEQEVDEFVENLNGNAKSGEYRKLLWTNSQGAQSSYTVTADFSQFDEIEVIFERAGDLITKRMKNNGSATFRFLYADYIVERTATISNNTLTFGNGAAYTSYNTATPSANYSYAVPSAVYGIKYEHVYPIQVDASDYIIEQGTSGIWTYRKWESGIAECWGNETVTVNFAQNIETSLYTTGYTTTTNYPSFFTSVDSVVCSASHGQTNGWVTLASGTVSGGAIVTAWLGWNTGGNQSVKLYINLKGRWK